MKLGRETECVRKRGEKERGNLRDWIDGTAPGTVNNSLLLPTECNQL